MHIQKDLVQQMVVAVMEMELAVILVALVALVALVDKAAAAATPAQTRINTQA
jgi:hypothetical protein